VETSGKIASESRLPVVPSFQLGLLGPMAIRRDGVTLALPGSRKVRALLAYLAVAPSAVSRSELCELLWDTPKDPRAELRWSLSKVRSLVDQEGRRRVYTDADAIELNLSDWLVDASEVSRAIEHGPQTLAPPEQRALIRLFRGEFLEGLEIDGNPLFNSWLTVQRRRFRGLRISLLEHLVASVPEDEAHTYLEQWLQLAPFDRRAHGLLLSAFAARGRIREGEDHLAAAARLFEAEGLECSAIREAWRSVRAKVPVDARGDADQVDAAPARRASIAVMPFADWSQATSARGGVADALAHDVITRLAKLRSLFVIAQGTVFALHERQIGAEEAGRMLNVDYVTSGTVRHVGDRIVVAVELVETRTARMVWAETFSEAMGDTFLVLDGIGNRIVASIANQIEVIERNRAILKPPSSLDAWEAHHRGLWHMYLFNKTDNERARYFFEAAVRLDPTFARAHAGLSFTHFQDAFLAWAEREPAIDRAFEAAGRSLMVDDLDPAAHWAMGRALWLRGRNDQSLVELERAIDLSPNFALGHYTLAFVHAQAGDPQAAIRAADHSRSLSPFDPLLFGMLGARAIALVRLGRLAEAADWAVKAAVRPNSHAHILAIAAFSLALTGAVNEARVYAAAVRKSLPRYGIADFVEAFRFDPHGEGLFRSGAKLIGMV
jgi:DNA-binding SARP family transcriptional activator